MHQVVRKFYKGCLIATMGLLSAWSSTEISVRGPPEEKLVTSTTRNILEKSTTQTPTLLPQTSTTVPPTAFSTEELIPVTSLQLEKEIAAETTLVTPQPDTGKAQETENLDLIKEIIRTPTKNEPLSVVTIGDSVSYDADLGIKAVLESTKTVEVTNRSFGGVGLTQKGFQNYLDESLLIEPEVMTVMLGGWDLAFLEENQEEYEKIIEDSIEQIYQVLSTIILIAQPTNPVALPMDESTHIAHTIHK